MPVSREVRDVEIEIDSKIQALRIWKTKRSVIFKSLMEFCEKFTTLVHLRAFHSKLFKGGSGILPILQLEQTKRNGVYWALKWSIEFSTEDGSGGSINPDDLREIIHLGEAYDVLVDALKLAEKGDFTITVSQDSKEITCYEGADITGFDSDIVTHQQLSGPLNTQVTLTGNSDQLTSQWKAGDYRRVTRRLARIASDIEGEIGVRPELRETLGMENVSIPKPTLVTIKRPRYKPDKHVFDSLTVPSGFSKSFKWNARSFLETPIVRIDCQYCALSSDLKVIADFDDYMLRLAAREDPHQYSMVSGLREDRMIEKCRTAFRKSTAPWDFRSKVELNEPKQEVDVLASRNGDEIALELKSTLRPETLWEVHKRNEDIMSGLTQIKSIVDRGVARIGLLLTDGYRGDYRCWGEAIRRDVTIGTLHQIEELAQDPDSAIQLMKENAGAKTNGRSGQRLPDRETEILGWTLRLVDAEPKE